MNPGRESTLAAIFKTHRRRLFTTYALLNVENIIILAQPLVLGLAIDDLLKASYRGLGIFIAQHLAFVAVGSARRFYDTRAFTHIYTTLATGVVVTQRERQVDVSIVAARAALSRELVDFFERDVPMLWHVAYSIVGALAMLLLYDWVLTLACLVLLVPLYVINRVYSRGTRTFNERLNDQLEKEVRVITDAGRADVRRHYDVLATWRIKLSDWDTMNFVAMELFVVGLIIVSLARFWADSSTTTGEVFAIFTYILMYVGGLDDVPYIVQQVGRLLDISSRLEADVQS
jgi:ABC-type multidrug transport system fused ATPase/permease subunit